MARNLVQEKREEEAQLKSEALEAKKVETIKPENSNQSVEEKIVYVTTEQVTLNNLNVVIGQLEVIYSKMIEGFKQVGVKFEEVKESK